jgi:hypothetical protein
MRCASETVRQKKRTAWTIGQEPYTNVHMDSEDDEDGRDRNGDRAIKQRCILGVDGG